MKIGIIGDTHDQIPELKKAIQTLRDEKIDLLIHAGDWVSAFTLEYYREMHCPIRGVWGNNVGDPRFQVMAHKVGLDLEIADVYSEVYDGRRVHVAHELDKAEHMDSADVFIYGHDHVAKIEEKRGMVYINPGTLLRETFPWLTARPSVAVYDTASNQAGLLSLDSRARFKPVIR
jgi:hypothetical protein